MARRMIVALAVLSLVLVAVAGTAVAKNLSGTKGSNTLVGTNGADKIKGKGGNDKLKGKNGNDSLKGGKGNDKVTGGKGADRHLGGAGNDVLNAADGRLDKAIDGGGGQNTCIVDTALELSILKGCGSVVAGGPGLSGPPPADGLRLLTTTVGLNGCAQPVLPLCEVTITGDGANATFGTVVGLGGVIVQLGLPVSIDGSNFTTVALYACTSDGAIRITIGSEVVDVPVDCALNLP